MTEPPCSENVTWILLKTPLEVSSRDIERFRSIMGQNNRPLQAINARPVLTGHR
jgi:carbonic anhydrase